MKKIDIDQVASTGFLPSIEERMGWVVSCRLNPNFEEWALVWHECGSAGRESIDNRLDRHYGPEGHDGTIGNPSDEEVAGYVRFRRATGREIDFKLDEQRMMMLQVWVREGQPIFEHVDGVYKSKTFGRYDRDLLHRIGRCYRYVKDLDQFGSVPQ